MVLALVAGACSQQPVAGTETERTRETFGPSTTEAPDTNAADPITGYGDFSQYDSFDINAREVIEALSRCMSDHGFSVAIIPPGDGLSFADVPPEQSATAQETLERCRAGLSLPQPRPPNREELRSHFEALLEAKECVESMGYAVEPPPDFETFADTYTTGTWHPFSLLDSLTEEEWQTVQQKCASWRTES